MLTPGEWLEKEYPYILIHQLSDVEIHRYMDEYAAYVLEYNFQIQLIQLKK